MGKCVDLDAAYGPLAIAPTQRSKHFELSALPFAAAIAVHDPNRVSKALEQILAKLFHILCMHSSTISPRCGPSRGNEVARKRVFTISHLFGNGGALALHYLGRRAEVAGSHPELDEDLKQAPFW